MARQVEFLFDVGSPTAYLAWTRLPVLLEATGAEAVYTPILLGGLFKASGNPSPTESPAKINYTLVDCARFAARWKTPFQPNPHFPVNTLMAMRAIMGAQMDGAMAPVLAAAFKAMWVDGVNLAEPNALEALAEDSGVGVDRLVRWIGDETVKAQLRANTDHAAQRGAFGAPTFFVGEQMFFGQDRMAWVKDALLAA